MVEYAPNRLVYHYSTSTNQLAVFSDIYYIKGWIASVNGVEDSYFRVKYILRAMVVHPGEGSIVFEFKPKSYFIGSKITFAESLILIIIVIRGMYFSFMRYKKKS